jgi:hypothetical protein
MQDSLAAFPEIAPGESGVSDTVRFELVNPTALTMNLLVEDMTGIEPRVILSRLLKLRQRPTAPVDLRSTSEPSAVSLGWGGPPNTSYIWGYRVYRAANSAGPYERIGTGYVAGARVYKDENVPDAAEFWYRVAAVDSSGVEGRRSGVAFGVPSPKMLAGWPKDVPDSRDGCPTIENLSGAGDREIVVLSDVVHVFNADGGDYYDGDHNPATIGRFTPDLPNGQNLLGKPAVADLDLDEQLEVIAAATNGYNGNWNPPAALVVLNRYGRVLWERPLLGRPVTSAPAVGNIDGDNEKEIVLITGRYVWAFNHDGTSVNPNFPDGKLLLIPGGDVQESPGVYKVDWQLASVALANIDQDDRDEIVFTTRSGDSAFNKLYIINGVQSVEGQPDTYGTNYNIFPFTYADHVAPGAGTQYSNSSPAVGDFTSKLDMRPDGAPDIALLTYNRLWAIDPTNPGQQLADKLVWAKETQTLWTGGENPLTPSPALGDVDADGAPDVAVGSNNGAIYVFDGSGRPLEGFRQESYLTYLQIGSLGSRMGSPIMADIDGVVEGDGMRHPEVVIGDSEGFVYAVRKGGQMVPGFPYAIPGAKIGIGLTAWDIDRDGYQNLVIQTDKVQAIRVLEFPACPFSPLDADIRAANPWPQFRHDASNSGYYPNDIVTPVLTLNLDGSAADGDRVQIRWRTETAVASFAAARREGLLADWESIGQWPAAELLQEDGSYLLEDRVPAKGEWSYRIEGLDAAGALQLSGEVAVQVGVPAVFRLHPARPNPFNPRTLIRLDLPQTTLCDLRIVDVTGRTVRRLLSGRQPAGSHDLVWDGRSDLGHEVGSGIYFVQAMAVGYSDQKEKLVLLK